MGNVLLCTHSTLAEGFERAVMMIVRAAPSLEILCFEDGCSIETLMEQMRKKQSGFVRRTKLTASSPICSAPLPLTPRCRSARKRQVSL